jgi:MFS family permease
MPESMGGVQVSEKETPVDADRTIFWVQVNMGMKVLADCAPISVWPALLKDLYGGDVGQAALAAATMSSCCGVIELILNPLVGVFSDAFGRKFFFYLGPLANGVLAVLQVKFNTSIPMAWAQRIISQSMSTIAGTTVSTASLSDVASGSKLSVAAGKVGSWAGLGVIAGPMLAGFGNYFFPGHEIASGYLVRAGCSGVMLLVLAFGLKETHPRSKRRPVSLQGVNPLAFLRLFTLSKSLCRLGLSLGLSSMCEGKMTNDVVMMLLREQGRYSPTAVPPPCPSRPSLWLAWPATVYPPAAPGRAQVSRFLVGWGICCYCSGQYLVRPLLKRLTPRVFTGAANLRRRTHSRMQL